MAAVEGHVPKLNPRSDRTTRCGKRRRLWQSWLGEDGLSFVSEAGACGRSSVLAPRVRPAWLVSRPLSGRVRGQCSGGEMRRLRLLLRLKCSLLFLSASEDGVSRPQKVSPCVRPGGRRAQADGRVGPAAWRGWGARGLGSTRSLTRRGEARPAW